MGEDVGANSLCSWGYVSRGDCNSLRAFSRDTGAESLLPQTKLPGCPPPCLVSGSTRLSRAAKLEQEMPERLIITCLEENIFLTPGNHYVACPLKSSGLTSPLHGYLQRANPADTYNLYKCQRMFFRHPELFISAVSPGSKTQSCEALPNPSLLLQSFSPHF